MSDYYYSVQVRISAQVKQLAEEMARRDGVTLKAWIEAAIREKAHVEDEDEDEDEDKD